MVDDIKDPEKTEEELRQEVAEKWKDYVRSEVNAMLDSFLEVADKGTIGVKYDFVAKGLNEDGSVAEHNTKEARGVQVVLSLEFEKSLYFTDEEGFTE